tara:strand:+ start:69 stop:569 length:501 start_codon:yes stop_codon:yes gene_type:complete
MYGQSPYGNVMGRGMFMQPQMQQMLQMRDQMRRPQARPDQQFQTQGPESYQQQPMPAQLPSDDLSLVNISEPPRQYEPQEMSTEDSLMQVQQALTNMQQQQQQLSQHLGAGSGMLQQQYQGGLGGLFQGNLTNQPVQLQRTQGPESLRLRTQGPTNTMYQGNPFGA